MKNQYTTVTTCPNCAHRFVPSSVESRILAAIRAGAETRLDIAKVMQVRPLTLSTRLSLMLDRGAIVLTGARRIGSHQLYYTYALPGPQHRTVRAISVDRVAGHGARF